MRLGLRSVPDAPDGGLLVIARRRVEPTDDLMSVLVHAEVDGDRLDDEELNFESLLILVGGDETTRHVVSGGIHELLRNADQVRLLHDDPSRIPVGVEETGKQGHSVLDAVMIPVFRVAVAVIDLAKDFSPIDSLSTGRSVSWAQLGRAFAQIVVMMCGLLAGTGIAIFSRRELATAQGTQ